MERRDFMQVCAASALGLRTPQSFAAADARPRHYARTRLTDESGQALRASHLAAGTLGGEMFNTLFTKYEMRLALEHGSPARAQQRVAETTAMTALARFCKQQVRC